MEEQEVISNVPLTPHKDNNIEKPNIQNDNNIEEQNTQNVEKPKKKRGRKPIFKNPKIIDPSIYNNKTISDAKKINKKVRDERRLSEDVQYDNIINTDTTNEDPPNTLHDIFKAIVMLKNNKEYNLYDALNNTNAGITFAQLFAVSPSLRKLCSKGLKLNKDDLRHLSVIKNFEINDEDLDIISDTKEELDYAIKNNTINIIDTHSKNVVNNVYSVNKNDIATVLGFVDDIAAKVLIDTGSSVNVIKYSFYNKISKEHKAILRDKTFFKLASDNIVTSQYTVPLCLQFENLSINSLFWVLDDSDSCYDIILGRRSQKENRLYIDPDDDGLYMKQDNNQSICVANSTGVPNNTQVIYRISLTSNSSQEVNFMNDFYPNPLSLKNLIKNFDKILKNPIKEFKSPPILSTEANKNYNKLNVISDTIYSSNNEENSSTPPKIIAKIKRKINTKDEVIN